MTCISIYSKANFARDLHKFTRALIYLGLRHDRMLQISKGGWVHHRC